MSNLDHWTEQVHGLTLALRRRHPKLAADLDDITHLADQIAHAQPRAEAVTDPGDGLRSPNLEPGSRPIGSHSDPTATTALAHRTGRHADTLATAASHRREVVHALRMALSVADGVDVGLGPLRATDRTSGTGEWTYDHAIDHRSD